MQNTENPLLADVFFEGDVLTVVLCCTCNWNN